MLQSTPQQHFDFQRLELAKEFYARWEPDTPTARDKASFTRPALTTLGWRTEQLGRRRTCIVLHRPCRPPTLWVPPSYSLYRTAYQEFLAAYFGFTGRLPRAWQVDHLNPRVRFDHRTDVPDLYVRLALLPASVNSGYGWLERAYCAPKVGRRLAYGKHGKQEMHMLMFCKAVGVAPPTSAGFEELVCWCGRAGLELAGLLPDEPSRIFDALYMQVQRTFDLPTLPPRESA